jgi:predicted  nucleic acid-binding Zn-ribbon protein
MRTLLVAAVLFALPAMAETSTTTITQDALNNAAATTNKALTDANKAIADANAALTASEKSLTAEQKALIDTKTKEAAAKNAALDAAAKSTH